MNEAQKKIMISVAIGLVITFLFPPHATFYPNGVVTNISYSFIANTPARSSIHMVMLFAEWLGIVVIGGIAFFIAQNTQREYNQPSHSNYSKESAVAQASAPNIMSKYKRWLIRIIGFLLVLLIYSIWKEIDKETGTPTALLRGAFVGISLLWITKISNAKSVNKELKSETYPEKTNTSAKVWLLVIGTVILVIWLAPHQESKNTLPVSTTPTLPTQVQTQPVQAQQPTTSNTNSANDMFQRANDFYNQGRYAEALPLYQQLARYSGAQIRLGGMYESGNGVTKDYNQAIYWYRKAAEIGDENEKDAKAALEKVLGKEKMEIPHQVRSQPAQARHNKPSNADADLPPKIPGDTNNDGILSGSEQYLRDNSPK